jgi:POT family proton-dependent oligopeptide transporter
MNPQAAPKVPEGEQADQVVAAAAPQPTNHPTGFYFFFWGEFAERCSYYGMRAIMPLYLTSVLLFEDSQATRWYSYFKSACYFLPLLGGWLADRYFGKYWTIVGFSIPYVLGHFVLGIQNQFALLFAMALLAGGSGVIKPNISTLMGLTYDQKRPGQTALRTQAFLWFYFSINIGAVISQYALPSIRDYVRDTYSDPGLAYRVAFQFPAWLMVISLAVFAAGKRFYAVEKIDRDKVITPEEKRQRWEVLSALFGIFALMVIWWMVYEHNDVIWVFFARDHIDCTLNLGFTKLERAPDGFQFINPLGIITLVPLLAVFLPKIDPQTRVFTATRKIFAGFLFTVAAAGIMALAAQQSSSTGAKVSAWWIVWAYIVLTIGEILLYGTGLELSYTAAPPNLKGFVTGCFLVTNSLGNIINASYFGPMYNTVMPPTQFFTVSALVVLAAGIAFYFVGKRFDRAGQSAAAEAGA